MKTADTQFADWLNWFTDESLKPFALGDGRRAATNARYLIATTETGPVYDVPTNRQKVPPKALELLAEPAISTLTVDIDVLRAAVGPCEHPTIEKCPECKGTREKPHFCSCDLCEIGTVECDCENGKVEEIPDKRYMTIFGQIFNVNFLAYILTHVPPTTGEVELRLTYEKIHVIAVSWHAVLCVVKDTPETRAQCQGELTDMLRVPVVA